MASYSCATHARLAQAEVERVLQQRFVVGADIEQDRQGDLRRHAGAGRVQRQLADGDAHAVGAEVAQAKDTLAVGDDDDADVPFRPVAQDLRESGRGV